MLLIYQLGILFYVAALKLASINHVKARQWFRLRKDFSYKKGIRPLPGQQVIWMHASSAGEFEQGRPVFTLLRKRYPKAFFVLSFFSPSGYLANNSNVDADQVILLPPDLCKRSSALVKFFKPDVFILVKYDFWFCLLEALYKQGTKKYLISARFDKHHWLFRWYGKGFAKYITCFECIFVQDEASKQLLKNHFYSRAIVTGDTRADRVFERRSLTTPVLLPATDTKRIIAGSVWSSDIHVLSDAYRVLKLKTQWIIAPHEPTPDVLEQIKKTFSDQKVVLFSDFKKNVYLLKDCNVLVVDTIGDLFDLYAAADIAYVGGGFGKSVHNLLEPASAGIPVLFGPQHKSFPEGAALLLNGGGYCVENPEALANILTQLLASDETLLRAGSAAREYIHQSKGASEKVFTEISKGIGEQVNTKNNR